MYSEWELLAIADGIEEGDTISVDTGNGEEPMIYLGAHGKETIKLVDRTGAKRIFSANSLEEVGDSTCYIIGISDVQLTMKQLRS